MADIRSFSDYLAKVRIPIRLSFRTESGWPFVLSLWFIYRDGLIYCATQEDARIVRYLENEPRCGFEIAGDLPPYCGIRGQARARVDRELGAEILEALLIRYLNGVENPLAKRLQTQAGQEVALVLDPINCFSWNFTERMKSVLPEMLALINKECPS
jgi:hypothetical protein